MDNNLIDTLVKQRDEIQDKIDNYQKYNEINYIRRKIVKTGLVINYALPFILSAIILFSISKKTNNTPFIIDNVEEKEKIELIDSSNGYHEENICYGENNNSKIEYSEKWKKNEYGLYERKVTSYIMYDIDINDRKTIFSMSKEELENNLIKLSEEIFTKPYLEEKDKSFMEDCVIITRIVETENIKKEKESKGKNIIFTLLYIAMFFIIGNSIKLISRVLIRDKITNKLKEIDYKYIEIDEKQLEKLKEILKIREENINLLNIEKEDYHGKCI